MNVLTSRRFSIDFMKNRKFTTFEFTMREMDIILQVLRTWKTDQLNYYRENVEDFYNNYDSSSFDSLLTYLTDYGYDDMYYELSSGADLLDEIELQMMHVRYPDSFHRKEQDAAVTD